VQNGNQCFCDNSYSTPSTSHPKQSDAECNKGCARCGGPWRNAIYEVAQSTPLPAPSSKYTYGLGTAPPSTECIFPFTFNGSTYTSCANVGEAAPHPNSMNYQGQVLPYGWCSTTGATWKGKWGSCGGCQPGWMNYPSCNETCNSACKTCHMPVGRAITDGCLVGEKPGCSKDAKSGPTGCDLPNQFHPGFSYKSSRCCTSCRREDTKIGLTSLMYKDWSHTTVAMHSSGLPTIHELDYIDCHIPWKDQTIVPSDSYGAQHYDIKESNLALEPSQQEVLTNRSLTVALNVFSKSTLVTKAKMSLYDTGHQHGAAGPGYEHFPNNNGENWFPTCLLQKWVRCTPNLSGSDERATCTVGKTGACQKVSTTCVGPPCRSDGTVGEFETSSGVKERLPLIDSDCKPRPPLIPSSADWCEDLVTLL
jgi:hypothetical protein